MGSINDLKMRHGFGAMASTSPPRLQRFSLVEDRTGLWVAEQDSDLVGFGFSWISDGLWFLAQLFVTPGIQLRPAIIHRPGVSLAPAQLGNALLAAHASSHRRPALDQLGQGAERPPMCAMGGGVRECAHA